MGKTYYKQELIILVLKKFTYQNIIISKYISKYHYKNIISNKTLFKVIRNARCTEARCFRFNQTDLTFDATFARLFAASTIGFHCLSNVLRRLALRWRVSGKN